MNIEQSRVFFKVEMPSGPAGPLTALEGLWAEKVGPDLYRLLNIPFFARGYAWGDVIRCDAVQDRLFAGETVTHSGSSTIRVLFRDPETEEAGRVVGYLQYLGCTYESNRNLYTFDVPGEPELKVSMGELAAYLNEVSRESDNFDWETGKWPRAVDPNTH